MAIGAGATARGYPRCTRMTDREDLPDTDDPYALLGIGEEATDKEVRRAYLRRLKKHPPERDPDGFQRIRNAYEQLTGGDHGAPRSAPPARHPPANRPVAHEGPETGAPPEDDGTPPSFPRAESLRSYLPELEAIERALDEDRLEKAVEELLALPHSASDGNDLVPLVLRTVCAVVWKDRRLVDRIAQRYAAQLYDGDGDLGEQARIMMGLALDIETWREELGDPDDPLLLYLRRGAVAGVNERHRIAVALCEDLVANRSAFYERLEAIDSETVLEYLRERLARDAARHGWRPWHPSALGGKAYMIVGDLNLMRAEDKKLTFATGVEWVFIVVALLAFVYGLQVHWTLGLGAPVGVIVFGYWMLRGTTAGVYRRVFVPRLLEHLWNYPIRPDEIASEYDRHRPSGYFGTSTGADSPEDYPDMIRHDEALGAYAEAVNLARVVWK